MKRRARYGTDRLQGVWKKGQRKGKILPSLWSPYHASLPSSLHWNLHWTNHRFIFYLLCVFYITSFRLVSLESRFGAFSEIFKGLTGRPGKPVLEIDHDIGFDCVRYWHGLLFLTGYEKEGALWPWLIAESAAEKSAKGLNPAFIVDVLTNIPSKVMPTQLLWQWPSFQF